VLRSTFAGIKSQTGPLAEGWSILLTQRPNLLIIEVGFVHTDRRHALLRQFLHQVRDRFGSDIYVAIALTSPETLSFGGDLLYANPRDLEPSGYVDTYVASPPSSIPSVLSLSEQVINVVRLYSHELKRRAEDKAPLPALGAQGWVQSLSSPQSRQLWMQWLPRYASYTNENPLILGATGTGKTNLARALHNLSGRKGEFISITPRDFSSSELVQVELFGAVAGAYTGAVDKWGLVKSAEGGTLFIDELQSIDKELQGKLITFIENKSYRRVGSAESIKADVRFVFASNRSLYDMMQTETLRDDFAYRLERLQLDLRPLESRRLDICSALAYSLAKIRRQRPLQNHITGINSSAYRQLIGGHWPGNLRQLENSTARLCEIADMEGKSLIEEDMVRQVMDSTFSATLFTTSEVLLQAAHRLAAEGPERLLNSLEEGVEQYIEFIRVMALEATGGNLDEAAQLIQEDPQLLEVIAQSILSNREMH
jgi:transcriptional regulator with PAS, ATPase and Fis domain